MEKFKMKLLSQKFTFEFGLMIFFFSPHRNHALNGYYSENVFKSQVSSLYVRLSFGISHWAPC